MRADEDSTLIEDEGAGYLVSISDLMSGLLFIFIITLMAFVYNFQQAENKAEAEQALLRQRNEMLDNTRRMQSQLLQSIKEELAKRGIQVVVVHNQGVLRLSEDAIRFRSGSDALDVREQAKLGQIADVLAEVLPCYTALPPEGLSCAEETVGKLESVFIEGHTDNQPVARGFKFSDNWELSARRAIAAYRVLETVAPSLIALRNPDGDPLFSVSGYGAGRPVNEHVAPTPDAENRRIDLRFIMVSPVTERKAVEKAMSARGIR